MFYNQDKRLLQLYLSVSLQKQMPLELNCANGPASPRARATVFDPTLLPYSMFGSEGQIPSSHRNTKAPFQWLFPPSCLLLRHVCPKCFWITRIASIHARFVSQSSWAAFTPQDGQEGVRWRAPLSLLDLETWCGCSSSVFWHRSRAEGGGLRC